MTIADMGHLGEIIIGAIIGALALAWRYGGKEQQLEGRVTRLEQWREGREMWMERVDEKMTRMERIDEKLTHLIELFKSLEKDVRALRKRRFGDRRRPPRTPRTPRMPGMRTRWYDELDEYMEDDEEDI